MTELETLRTEIDELRYDLVALRSVSDTTRTMYGEAILRLKAAVEALATSPGSPHVGAVEALAALNGQR